MPGWSPAPQRARSWSNPHGIDLPLLARRRARKTILAPVWLGFVLLVQGGCLGPLKSNVVSEKEIGVRADATAGTRTAVVRRVVKQNYLSPMTEEGYGKDSMLREQYYLKNGEKESRRHFLEISWSDVRTHGVTKPPYS